MKESKTLDAYPEILTAQHIADYLHISRRRVYELLEMPFSQGGIPCIVIGLSKRVQKETFIKWMHQKEKGIRLA